MARIFLAVEVSDEVRAELVRAHGVLATRLGDAVRFTRPDQLHLTLIFLGEIEEAALPRLLEAVESGAQATPFAVTLDSPGAFPDSGPASVLWVGLSDPHGKLRSLVDSLTTALRSRGFRLEERAFVPHLTLGRCKEGGLKGRKVVGELAITPFPLTVDRIVVFRSEKGSEGARHIPLEVFKLRGGGGL